VDSFLYLECIVTKTGGAEEDEKRHIRQVNGTFTELYPAWKNNVSGRKKLQLFSSNVKSVLSYGYEE
jgi:hypothetical protein